MKNTINLQTIRSFLILMILLFCTSLYAQQTQTVKGVVVDELNGPIAGVTIVVKNSTKGVITDLDGNYTMSVLPNDILVFSFIGMETLEVPVNGKTVLNVTMGEKVNAFDEVTVVAFAKQKKESVIGSISTIKPAELKTPVSNLTNALGGRMSGIISYQQSGEPGKDNAKFFVRGVTTFGYKQDPLILIDNVELSSDDLARLNVDDIEQFSIMKDATSTALYGARGANGVIFVTTKQGREGKAKVSLRAEGSFSEPNKMVDVADPIKYMEMYNEANYNDFHRGMYNVFSREKIERTASGVNPYAYPAVKWHDELFKDNTFNQRYNLSISGGGTMARYYIAANFNKDDGILKNDKLNNFNSNINLKKYGVRSNINIDVTKTTELILRINGTFDDYTGPIDSGDGLFNKAMRTSPVLFPKSFPHQEGQSNTHILFGNEGVGNYINPYADMVRGYKEYNRTVISAQLEMKQNLKMLLEGLNARVMVSTSRYSYTDLNRAYDPFYYTVGLYLPSQNDYVLLPINPNGGKEYLGYNPGGKDISTTNYMEGALDYAKAIGDHSLSGLLVFQLSDRKISNADELQKSLAYRNLGLSGRFTYAYDSRYFAEFNFGYNGSERFAKNERFGFFPSIGLGYMISNEAFWEPLEEKINKLKLKLTYGLVGNDAIGSDDDRFFYLPNLKMDDDGKRQYFGTDFTNGIDGITVTRYANSLITWERSKKLNAGIEVGLFNGTIDIQADYFREKRDRILLDRTHISSTMGLSAGVKANLGEATSQGVDFSIDANYMGPNTFWAVGRANFTYATSKYDVFEEPDYAAQGTPWNSRIGKNLNQNYGYIAERLFIDENDIANSPDQSGFGEYRPGDIKYKDIDKDGKITEKDRVYMGWPTSPEITFGFGFSLGYKGWDLNTFFQGNARVSLFLEPRKIAPFVDGLTDQEKDWAGLPKDKTIVTGLINEIANNHWSESNRDSYAFWPRLSTGLVNNNNQTSNWWMRDGSFIRLKTLEIGYTIPSKWLKKLRVESCRIYVNGNNLLTMSKFKLWDPEQGSNGLNYPLQRVYNAGVSLNF
ncbi:TonB-dependent receptor [Bacteroides sp. 51]|uniref:SusC/RagA family TonB-linked outer membrane protein n=1 Tax=Bacteroides sp. 51 TaxID=2302938 RepID=UPI0013D08A33|nr:TonB-dependent receptor [Bacteroides sp. 51]NDV80994.1 TonB-dependent receptor [Bacteroides sp. 51]